MINGLAADLVRTAVSGGHGVAVVVIDPQLDQARIAEAMAENYIRVPVDNIEKFGEDEKNRCGIVVTSYSDRGDPETRDVAERKIRGLADQFNFAILTNELPSIETFKSPSRRWANGPFEISGPYAWVLKKAVGGLELIQQEIDTQEKPYPDGDPKKGVIISRGWKDGERTFLPYKIFRLQQ
jgi:hypothetical protein